jgi:hypothetical protein
MPLNQQRLNQESHWPVFRSMVVILKTLMISLQMPQKCLLENNSILKNEK